MSPEHDPNLQPSVTEAASSETVAEDSKPETSGEAQSLKSSLSSGSRISTGAATAVVRAQESSAVSTAKDSATPDGKSSSEMPVSAEENIAPSPAESASTASIPEKNSSPKPEEISVADQHAALEGREASSLENPSVTEMTSATISEIGATAEVPSSTENVESSETMDQLLDQFAVPEPVAAEGEIFDGRVLAVTDAGVIVDVGGKFEGLVPAQEFVDSGSPIQFGKGQTIEVERLHEQKNGYVLLSHVRAHRRRVWERIEKSYREHATITGKVTERIKGGLVIDIGVRAFLPASQIELRPVHDLDTWKDRDIEVRVLKLNRKRGNVVVSRRAILEEEQKSKRDELMASLSEGSVITGRVKNVTDYGVFVDLGGMDGLLHVSDLVWGRVPHPSSIVKPGDEIEVQILKFDKDKQRISLGRKQLLPDPWATVPERFPVGTRVQGKIVGVTDYGAFVQIEPGVEGLVHVSEMSWSKRSKHPSKMVKAGDEVEVTVLEVQTDQRRISLGLKQTMPDPWNAAAEKYPVGTIVNGRIRNLADFGAFVEIEEGMEGLIHISDISWTERLKHPSEKFKKGDAIEAKVLKVDSQNRRLSLGIKQVKDIWANWFAEHKIGEVIKGKVTRTTDFGAFVELAEGIEGLCHVSEIEERKSKGDRAKEKPARGARVTSVLVVGGEHDFKILRLEPEQHKISLSYRAAQKQVERQEIETFRAAKPPKSSPNATIGDAIMAKRQLS
ncbi:MAG TPA: 30S ribosomal protein S1 [Candidatus Acidoferrales bacterium]|nr:30S ribosomal protein S1 [Candidatus Acidoferrales bacterium]